MKAIVTIAILYEVPHPKLIFSKYLNCVSLCVNERRSCLRYIFFLSCNLEHQKAPCAPTPKTDTFCMPNPKSRHLRLLESLIFLLWLHLWEKIKIKINQTNKTKQNKTNKQTKKPPQKQKEKRTCSWKLVWKRHRGGGKYAPTMFLKDRNYLLFVSYVP